MHIARYACGITLAALLAVVLQPQDAPTDRVASLERRVSYLETLHAEPTGQVASDLIVEVISDKVSDTPIKAEVEQHLVLSGAVEAKSVEQLLRHRFERAMSVEGLRYHDKPTSVYIYAYETREQASAGQGLWFAMLQMNAASGASPRVTIRDELLAQLGKPEQQELGLSEAERRSIYKQLAAAEREAPQDAERKYPRDLMKQIDYEDVLLKQYQSEVARKAGITLEEVKEIIFEGVMSRWPDR